MESKRTSTHRVCGHEVFSKKSTENFNNDEIFCLCPYKVKSEKWIENGLI